MVKKILYSGTGTRNSEMKKQGLKQKRNLWDRIKMYRYFYLMLIPALLFYIIFCYVPMYGVTLAFKEYDFSKGILGSEWNNFSNFKRLFADAGFWRAFQNTLIISAGRLLFEFPVPIILTLLMHEISKSKVKGFVQTILTFPHFLSWVVLSGIVITLFQDQGIINQVLALWGGGKNKVLVDGGEFRILLFVSNIWKEAGWSTIIYLAAVSGISPELYEAARVDGANRFQQMLAVTWPGLKGTVAVMLILQVGGIMNGGFDQVFNLYNSAVYSQADILDTFVYRASFMQGDSFGYTTAVGLTKSIINFALLLTANSIVGKLNGEQGGII